MATSPSIDPAVAQHVEPVDPAAWLVVVPIALPLLAGAVCLVLRDRDDLQLRVSIGALSTLFLSNLILLAIVAEGGPLVMTMGNWLPPFGISLVVDRLSAVLLLTTSIAGLAGAVFSLSDIDGPRRRFGFHTFYLLLIAGVSGAFSTGDLFNLYVWFEVFLIASFGLIVLGGEPRQLDGAVKYGVLNLVATTFFLIAIAYLYGLVGTLNIADIAGAVTDLEQGAPIGAVAALFVLAFAMKAAAVPVQAWLPAAYHVPRITVAAIFGGLLTKVGVYGLLRVVVMLLPAAFAPIGPALGVLAGLTALVGVLAAIAEREVRRLLGFVVISGIGVMLVGIAIGTADALAGTIVYVVHSILATTAIYLTVGAIEHASGVTDLSDGAGTWRDRAPLAGLFLVFAFALAGLPPFSGLWPKVMLIEAALAAGSPWLAAVVVAAGFLTTVALGRVFILLVLRNPRAAPAPDSARTAERPHDPVTAGELDPDTLALLALGALALAVIALGVWPDPLIAAARDGAETLLDPAPYVDAVFGEGR